MKTSHHIKPKKMSKAESSEELLFPNFEREGEEQE